MFPQRKANYDDGYDTDGKKGLYVPVVETVDKTEENDALNDNAVSSLTNGTTIENSK